MTQSIALGDDEDWLVTDGDIVLVRGAEAVESLIQSRIPVQRGEWRFNRQFGVDWDALFVKGVDPSVILASVVAELARVPDVLAPTVGDFSIANDTVSRRLTIVGTVFTPGGTLAVSFSS